MPFVAITKPTLGSPTTKPLIDTVIDNLGFLNSQVSQITTLAVPNGSFEVDSDADGFPDAWTIALLQNGTFTYATSTVAHGGKAIKFTRSAGASNGGGTATSADFLLCTDNSPVVLRWEHKSSVAGIKNKVELLWYDEDQIAHGTPTVTLYESTANPTAWLLECRVAIPPAGARYFKIKLTGGFTDTDVAGDAWFDNVQVGDIDFRRKLTWALTTLSDTAIKWSPPQDCFARITVIGGGGGGGGGNGANGAGGGGAGGTAVGFKKVLSATVYSFNIGAGGVGGSASSNGVAGASSVFNSEFTGGGGGGGATAGTGGTAGTATGHLTYTAAGGANAGTEGGSGGHAILGGGGGAGAKASAGKSPTVGTGPGGGGGGAAATTEVTGANGSAGSITIEF